MLSVGACVAVGMLKVLQVCVRRQLWRSACSSAAGARRSSGAAGGRGLSRPGARTCTVDPNLEEQFVFVDCTGVCAEQAQLSRWLAVLQQFNVEISLIIYISVYVFNVEICLLIREKH